MTINYDQALQALKELAAERPDYVYPSRGANCVYANDDGTPSCIVGHVIYRLAPEDFPKVIEDYNSVTVGSLVDPGLFPIFSDLNSKKLYELLITAQDNQDSGYTWAYSVQAAIEKAEALDA